MITLLKENPILGQLSSTELDAVVSISKVENYPAGAIIFSKNQKAHYLFLLVDGLVQSSGAGGAIHRVHPGEIFGEIGIINQSIRTGEVSAVRDSSALKIDGNKLFDEQYIPPATSLKIVRGLAKKVSDYLIAREQVSTLELIKMGEDDQVEYKSTLRMNAHIGKKDPRIEQASLKTVAAFLNSKGGTLLVGVADEGTILGMEQDKFANHDKCLLHFTNLVKDKLGSFHLKYMDFDLDEVEGKFVLRVDCFPSTRPVYYTDGNLDRFYIRTGPATTDMRLSQVYDYISLRFYANQLHHH